MAINVFHSFKAIVKRLAVLLVGVILFLSLTQSAVLAAASSTETEPGAAPGITEPIPDENISEMKEQRREWQSKVSSSREAEKNEPSSLGETLKEKLNLDEITHGKETGKNQQNPAGSQ